MAKDTQIFNAPQSLQSPDTQSNIFTSDCRSFFDSGDCAVSGKREFDF